MLAKKPINKLCNIDFYRTFFVLQIWNNLSESFETSGNIPKQICVGCAIIECRRTKNKKIIAYQATLVIRISSSERQLMINFFQLLTNIFLQSPMIKKNQCWFNIVCNDFVKWKHFLIGNFCDKTFVEGMKINKKFFLEQFHFSVKDHWIELKLIRKKRKLSFSSRS